MTTYINPSTRHGGVKQIVVPERQPFGAVEDAPYDDTQHVRVNGEWVPVDTPAIVPDTLAPSAPTGLSSIGTISSDGAAADYELTWAAPTTNVDATPLTDFAYYVVRWRYTGTGSWATFVSNDPAALLPGLVLGANIEWDVLARDISGNDSTWATETITGAGDASDGKNKIYFKTTPPTGGIYIDGDVWFDADQDNQMYKRVGTQWIATQFGSQAIVDLSLTVAKFKTSTHQLY